MHLPLELWGMIFEDVDEETLPNVSLTCRRFHNLARRLIFSYFCLLFFKNNAIDRLNFYASDAIAPLVRKLRLTNSTRTESDLQVVSPPRIFDVFPRFINARFLTCIGFDFTRFTLQQISTLPSLFHLRLLACRPPPHADSLQLLRIHTLVYVPSVIARENFITVHDWLKVLDANHLQCLVIPLTSALSSFFNTIDSHNPFPAFHTIELEALQGTLQHVSVILSKTPSVRSFKLRLRREFMSPPHLDVFVSSYCLPNLEQYHGPHEALRVIRGRTTEPSSASLQTLCLNSIMGEGDSLDAYMASLELCGPHLRNLTRLHIFALVSMEFKSLTVLEDVFPLLQELHLYASKSGSSYDVPLDELDALPLPSTLTSVSIQWTSASRRRQETPNIAVAVNSILDQLPSLRRLWFCDWSQMALLWYQTLSGEERCTVQTVGGLRSNNDAWEMRVVAFPEDPVFVP